jgi:DNA-binding transcriptional LysR family regulator
MNEIDSWLPPVQTVRAFVAAVRLGSFARAGEALRLTHGAVSHHVAQMEHLIGMRLFERHRRGVVPTPEAVQLADRLGRILGDLGMALQEARRSRRPALTITMMPALAQRWLLPRLGSFQAQHPEIDLRLRPTAALLDLDLDGVDVAIRYGPGNWPGVEARKLADEWVFPVASPFFRNGRLPGTPWDLLDCTLIRNPRQPWAPWFTAAGLPGIGEPSSGPIVDDAGFALDMAARGQGIALARGILASGDLEAGRLVRLFPITVQDAYSYYLLARPGASKRPSVEALASWIGSQMAPPPSGPGALAADGPPLP